MLYRFLFIPTIFFSILFSFSQEIIDLENLILDNNEISNEKRFFIQTNNIGDPILSLIPYFDDFDFSLIHYSQKYRPLSYLTNYNKIETDSIYSHVIYQSAYKSGGLLKTFITRPVGKFLKFKFSYNHLNSEGYFSNQENKYSSLSFGLNYLNTNKPYYYTFSFSSNNANSYNNGGVIYDSSLGLDLMNTYLNNAQTIIKNRVLDFQQNYFINSNLILKHTILFNFFNREYIDPEPSSFHYSLTPLYYSIVSDYHLGIFYSRLLNNISVSNQNFNLEFNHNYYNTDNTVLPGGSMISNVSDVDVLFSNTTFFKEKNNIDFKLNFCPLGYNQNNYILDFNFYKKKPNFHHRFNFFMSSKKPNFFTRHYDTSYSFDWNSFLSIRRISGMWTSSLLQRKLFFSASMNHYRNYLYFNQLVSPVQSTEDIIYFNLLFTKKWMLNDFYFKSDFLIQYSDNDIISVPNIFFKQFIQYNHNLSDGITLLSSMDFSIFSKYYVNSYFPLTDLFYLQLEEKRGLIPFLKANISIYKDNFSIGCVLNNLTAFLYEGESLILGYPFAPPTFQLLIKWKFLN